MFIRTQQADAYFAGCEDEHTLWLTGPYDQAADDALTFDEWNCFVFGA